MQLVCNARSPARRRPGKPASGSRFIPREDSAWRGLDAGQFERVAADASAAPPPAPGFNRPTTGWPGASPLRARMPVTWTATATALSPRWGALQAEFAPPSKQAQIEGPAAGFRMRSSSGRAPGLQAQEGRGRTAVGDCLARQVVRSAICTRSLACGPIACRCRQRRAAQSAAVITVRLHPHDLPLVADMPRGRGAARWPTRDRRLPRLPGGTATPAPSTPASPPLGPGRQGPGRRAGPDGRDTATRPPCRTGRTLAGAYLTDLEAYATVPAAGNGGHLCARDRSRARGRVASVPVGSSATWSPKGRHIFRSLGGRGLQRRTRAF